MIKKLFCLFITLSIIFPSVFIKSYAVEKPSLVSDTAILMDARTGQILYEKQMDKVKYPASITKIITVALSFKHGNPDDPITVSKEDYISDMSATHIALIDGENVTLRDMQYAALLMSANDACNVIARHIAGSQEAFIEMMNQFAEDAGATSTHFSNAHGLPENDHYTTAHDMALMTREAIKNPDFLKVMGTVTYQMPANNKKPVRPFANQDAMLKSYDPRYYKDVIGGKLGWTEESRHTKVTVAKRENRTLIAVVMDSASPKTKYEDTKKLLDYGFDEFRDYTVSPQNIKSKEIDVTDGPNVIGSLNMFLSMPAKFSLHRDINTKDIIYKFPEITSIDKSQQENFPLELEIYLPDYAEEYMSNVPMKLKLDTEYIPALSTVTEKPKKEQMQWLAFEIGEILLISLGITSAVIITIMFFVFIRNFTILMRKRKHQKQLAEKRKKQMQNWQVIERQTSPYKMRTTSTTNLPPNSMPQQTTIPRSKSNPRNLQSNQKTNTQSRANMASKQNKKVINQNRNHRTR